MYENRIRHLEQMHAALNKTIDGLEKTGKFEDRQIHDLKKQRLSLRDQISELKKKQWEHDREHLDFDDE